MTLSWNEIRKRAIEFSYEWKDEKSEKSESQSFWNDFFNIFGISRRRVATYEKSVKLFGDKNGFIDLFWKGKLIVEHKSEGKSLDKAYYQALDYFHGLSEDELPKYVLVSDFYRFRLDNIDKDEQHEFELKDLADNIHLFDFILGHTKREYKDEDPVNIKAAELMGELHDSLKENGYEGHPLEVLLVRLMFCLFADDTGIFERGHFTYYIENKTNIDGSDVGIHIMHIFQILDTSDDGRQQNLDEDLNNFPYINGRLFGENLPIPSFDSDARKILLKCCNFDWSRVSPAIFGSMFQSVMDSDERRDIGAHYTSEKNIIKTIDALFLDDLWHEFNSHKNNKKYLQQLLEKISKMKFLDPACGCGTFLIIAYRELRRLQIEIHKQLKKEGKYTQQMIANIEDFDSDLNVDSMYGIEILEFPARIAEVALWLVDHQMNKELSDAFGEYYVRLPLKTAPNIINGNALECDWNDVVSREELTCILGNPPFAGKKRRNKEQNADMETICGHIKNYGILDYVCCWHIKSAEYIKGTDIKVGLVSTNSIAQGEQVGILWDYLLNTMNIKINFAHRTFKWFNQAKGKAQVYVIIIGFAAFDSKSKYLFDYESVNSDPIEVKVDNINPYLVNQKDVIIKNRRKPICDVPEISFGSMPNDAGNFLFNDSEKEEFLASGKDAAKFIRPFISAKEFLHNKNRWCLWLKDATPSEIKKSPNVQERIKNVQEYRSKSTRKATMKLAETPYLFGENRQPYDGDYILIPRHSSENRKYIPMAFLSHDNIAGDSCVIVKNASLYHFGVLTSSMHMAWVKQICGRIKSDYRYSNTLVYNNYPWPKNPTSKQITDVENRVKELLDIRKKFKDSSLADLYDPLMIPKELTDAHNKLNRVVERCYMSKPFKSDLERLELLFELYDEYIVDEKRM
jgi:hypothetical protein